LTRPFHRTLPDILVEMLGAGKKRVREQRGPPPRKRVERSAEILVDR
jgi:hypothetical protein